MRFPKGFAAALLFTGSALWPAACQQKKPSKTPAPVAETQAKTQPPALGDTSAAYAGHGDADLEGAKKRTRPEPKPVSDRDAALYAVSHGNPDGAAEFLRKHVEATPKDIDARLALARALLAVGKYTDAQAALEDKKGAPNDLRIVVARSQLFRFRGETAAAKSMLTAASKKNPKALELRGELLALLTATGHGEEPAAKSLMEDLYDAYDAQAAKTASGLLAVARAALARGSAGAFKDANMVLEQAEADAPAKLGSWIGDRVLLLRGEVFLEKYASDEAATTFGLILERDAWDPEALVGMARLHVHNLQFAAATRAAEEALQVNPDHPGAHAALARIALIEGRREETRSRVQDKVFAINPKHVDGLAVLAALAILETKQADYAEMRDRALALNAKNGRFFKELSDILGFLHLYPEADEVLAEGVKLAPRDPYVHAARGLNLLRLGKEKLGREELAVAWKRDSFNERTRNLLDLYEQSIDSDYSTKATGDLTVRMPNEDREFIEAGLVESVKRSRKELDQAYGFAAGGLRLEFFKKPDEFSVRTVGVPSLGAVAVCFGPLITFIGPYHGVHNIENVIRHELAHVYAIKKSRGRVPRWFTEGLSEWESELADPAWARESAQLLDEARRRGKLRRLSELELAFIRAESPTMMEVAYSTAAYAVRYLGQEYGRPKLVAMLEGFAQGKTTEDLFQKHLGKDLATVEKDFERWFFHELDTKVSGWHPTPDGERGDERDLAYRRAIEQVENKDTAAAIRSLEQLIADGGDGFAPRMLLARLIMDGPKPAGAERHLLAARKHHAESIEPLVRLAELARRTNNTAKEKKRLRAALKIDGDSFDPAARLLMLALVTSDTDAARIARRRAQGIAPLHPLSLAAAAHRAAKAGDKMHAKALLSRAQKTLREIEGGPAATFVVAALAADALGDKKAAKELAARAAKGKDVPPEAKAKLKAI